MDGHSDLLTSETFDLDIAVFLAAASAAAYAEGNAQDFMKDRGLSGYTPFDSGNVQGYYCSTQESALLVFRGTSNIGQWIRDARVLPAPFREWGWAHLGFVAGIQAVEVQLKEFDKVAKSRAHVWVAGHSLGGALAVLAAARLTSLGVCTPSILTYGQPAVGFADFAAKFNAELPGRLWHIINQNDIVPRVPPYPYRHCDIAKHIVRPGVFEAPQGLEETPRRLPEARVFSQSETLGQIIYVLIGRQREGLEAAPGGLELATSAPPQLDAFEFGRLQLALGAGEPAGLEGMVLEGSIPFLKDHGIAEYIRLLKGIREVTRG